MLTLSWKYLFLSMLISMGSMAAKGQTSGNNVEVISINAPCTNSQDCKKRSAIIFVHGLFGSAESWLNDQSGKKWPEMIASDAKMKNIDVFNATFVSHQFGDSPTASEISESLLSSLLKIYEKRYNKIMFIAHSFGGNLIRSHIVLLKSRWGHRALNNIRLVILLGSPTKGAPLAVAGSFFIPNPQTRTLVPLERNDYLELLNSTFVKANAKHRDFGCPSIRVFAGYEVKNTFGRMIVSKESATAGAFACKGFDKNHIDLAKPEDHNDEVYRSVLSLLILCKRGDDRVCPEPNRPRAGYWCGARENLRDDTVGGSPVYNTTTEDEACASQWPSTPD